MASIDSFLSLDVPTSTQWITFPVIQKQSVDVFWSDGSLPRRAKYYRTKCYWGDISRLQKGVKDAPFDNVLNEAAAEIFDQVVADSYDDDAPDVTGPTTEPPIPVVLARESEGTDRKLAIKGETTLFLASEFVDAEFRGGPIEQYHIQSLADFKDDKTGPFWITMQLNDCFHYGQNKRSTGHSGWDRWIVYHPPVAPGMFAPRIFQHRFTGLILQDMLHVGLDVSAKFAPGLAKLGLEGAKLATDFILDILKGVQGDPLHRFLDSRGLAQARALLFRYAHDVVTRNATEDQKQKEKKKTNQSDWQRHEAERNFLFNVLAIKTAIIQIIETLRSTLETKESDAHAKARAQIVTNTIAELQDTLDKKSGLIDRVISLGRISDKVTEREMVKTLLEFNGEGIDLANEWRKDQKHTIAALAKIAKGDDPKPAETLLPPIEKLQRPGHHPGPVGPLPDLKVVIKVPKKPQSVTPQRIIIKPKKIIPGVVSNNIAS